MTDKTQQEYDKHFNKSALLSNGGLVHLQRATQLWDDLQTMETNPLWKRELLHLRERALNGEPVTDPKLREGLANLGFLEADGTVGVDARNVILSAVTGDVENTHVVSPFTDWSDRKLAEFVNAVAAVKGDYQPELATRLLREAIGPEWLRRIQDKPRDPGGYSRN